MKRIVISAAFGSGNSLLKSLAQTPRNIDPATGTCHAAWANDRTVQGDSIEHTHINSTELIRSQLAATELVWLHIAQENIVQLVQRIVAIEFLAAGTEPKPGWAWTPIKHQQLAGPTWPAYSTDLKDYTPEQRNELCQAVWHRIQPWLACPADVDYRIDSRELFDCVEPKTIQLWLASHDIELDHEFLGRWQDRQQRIYQDNQWLFSWQPGVYDYMQPAAVDPQIGIY